MNGHLSRIDDGPNAREAIHDAVELKALERELGHMRDRIEGRAVELAASSNERLRLARKRASGAYDDAEAVSHPRSEFLAQISHELRTPLNVIIGFTEMMRQATYGPLGSPRYSEYLDHIRQSAERLLDLTGEVLDLCRFGTERHGLDEEELDLRCFLEQAIRMAGRSNDTGRVTIAIHTVEVLAILADPTILTQALVKLLAFLVKLPQTTGRIEVSGKLDGAGDFMLAIKAGGINAAAPDIARLINSFDRGGSVYCWGYPGPGLSLSMAKELVELHGGELRLSRVADGGLTVMAHLPSVRVVTSQAND